MKDFSVFYRFAVVVLLSVFSVSNAWCIETGDVVTVGDYTYELHVRNAFNVNDADSAQAYVVYNDTYKNISEVVLPEQIIVENTTFVVRKIADGAFSDCTELKNVTFPGTLQTIGQGAFTGCIGIASISLPNSVTSVSDNAFDSCTGITNLVLNTTHVEGWFRNVRNQITKVTLGDDVRYIDNGAFSEFRNLSSIKLPNHLISIGGSAFKSCEKIEEIVIPASVTSVSLTAFTGCRQLLTIKVEAGNSKYDTRNDCNAIIVTNTNKLLLGCGGSTIPDGVTEIGEKAFYNTSITEVVIPASVTKIGDQAFNYCSRLASLSVAQGNSSFESTDGCNAIIDKQTKQLLYGTYKTTVIPSTVTGIAPRAFAGVSQAFSIKQLPESFGKIDKQAFADCTGLESIKIPFNVGIIDTLAFGGCNGLKKFVIPASIYKIRKEAFRDCRSLDTLEIPGTVGELGEYVWMNCNNLKKVTVEDGLLKELPVSTFQGCSNLEEVTLKASSRSFKIGTNAFKSCNKMKRFYVTCSDGCPKAEVNAFGSDYSAIANTVLYAFKRNADDGEAWYHFAKFINVLTLNHFDEVTKLYYNVKDGDVAEVTSDMEDDTDIAKPYKYSGDIVIPDSVTIGGTKYPVQLIEERAFVNHTDITSVTIGKKLAEIGESAFEGCTGLTTLNVTDAKSLYTIGNAAFKNCSSLTAASLPDTTKVIGQEAFMNCTALATLKLPVRLKTLGVQAFTDCKALESVAIPKTITVIENSTFLRCAKLATVVLHDGITTINESAFGYCQALKNFEMPAQLQTIGASAFRDCKTLTDVTLPESLKSIGVEAFRYCEGLTNILLPTQMTTLNSQAFGNCVNLKSMALPAGMKIVNDRAFYLCTKLEVLTIGENVTEIGQEAFYGCPLRSIYCKPLNDPKVYSNSFSEAAYTNATIFLQEGANENYNNSLVWGVFKKGSLLTYSLKYVVDGEEYKTYVVNGGAVVTPEPIPVKGSRQFSGWKGEPELMPAKDSVITGSFMYDINFLVKKDGEFLTDKDTLVQNKNIADSLFYGAAVTAPQPWITGASIKWVSLPKEMPAADVTIVGSYVRNKYAVKYYVDGEEYRCDSVLYQGKVEPPLDIAEIPRKIFEWGSYPETMPAHDVAVYGKYIAQFYCDGINIRMDEASGVARVIKYTATGINSKFAFNKNTRTDLTTVVIPEKVLTVSSISCDVVAIDHDAFNGFTQLTSVTVPKTVESIGEQAFRDCRKLTTITLPRKVTEISNGAFMYCGKLEKVEAQLVRTIGSKAFYGCSALKQADFNYLEEVGKQAFYNCTALTDIHLYKVKKLGSEAFAKTVNIARIYCDATNVPQMDANTFESSVYENAIVYVGKEYIPAYKADENWAQFKKFDYLENHDVIYYVNGKEYKRVSYQTGELIVAEPEPTDGNRIFSGWSTIPAAMAHEDIVVTGQFRYILTYQFEGEVKQKSWVFSGESVEAPAVDEREGYVVYWENDIDIMAERDTVIVGYYCKRGDANGDGDVDIADAVTVVNDVVDKANPKFIGVASDVNNDGDIDIADAVQIVNYLVGKRELLSRRLDEVELPEPE